MSSRNILTSFAAITALAASISLSDSNIAMAQTAAPVTGNAANGAKLFVQCRACHTVNVGGRDGVGPNLVGVMGNTAGARTTYRYSNAMKNSKIRWTKENMDNFLRRPSALIPGNKMSFGGMPNAKARADMIAYMETLRAR